MMCCAWYKQVYANKILYLLEGLFGGSNKYLLLLGFCCWIKYDMLHIELSFFKGIPVMMPSVLVIPYPSAQIPEWVILTHAVKA